MISAPGIQDQLRLVGWLRWRMFVNGLRIGSRKLELAVKIIMGAGIAVGALLWGPLMGLGCWYALSRNKPVIISIELWVVFGVWLVLPLVVTGFGAEANPVSLLRFPLRYSTFVLLAFAHGLFDPVALAAIYWLGCMVIGAAVASLGAALRAIPAFAALALLNLLLNRTIFTWLSRLLAQRRTREILGALFVLLMISFQLFGPLTQRYGKRAVPLLNHLSSAQNFLPPGMAASVLIEKDGGIALTEFAGLLAYCGLLGWALSVRLLSEYRGENLSEASRPAAEERSTVHAGWSFTGVPPTVAALFEKDLHYLLRNTTAYFTLLAPVIVVIFLSLNRPGPHARHPFLLNSSSMLYPMGIGYVLLTLFGFAYNNLGYDGAGVGMLLTAPIRFRDVMMSKNLLHIMIVAVEMIIVSVLVQFVAGPTPLLVVGVTLAGALWVMIANLAAGNLVSLYFPRKLQFGQMRRQKASGMAAAVTLGVQLPVMGLAVGAYLLSRWAGQLALCGAVFLVLAGAAWTGYRYVLNLVSDIAWKRRETLIQELSRTE